MWNSTVATPQAVWRGEEWSEPRSAASGIGVTPSPVSFPGRATNEVGRRLRGEVRWHRGRDCDKQKDAQYDGQEQSVPAQTWSRGDREEPRGAVGSTGPQGSPPPWGTTRVSFKSTSGPASVQDPEIRGSSGRFYSSGQADREPSRKMVVPQSGTQPRSSADFEFWEFRREPGVSGHPEARVVTRRGARSLQYLPSKPLGFSTRLREATASLPPTEPPLFSAYSREASETEFLAASPRTVEVIRATTHTEKSSGNWIRWRGCRLMLVVLRRHWVLLMCMAAIPSVVQVAVHFSQFIVAWMLAVSLCWSALCLLGFRRVGEVVEDFLRSKLGVTAVTSLETKAVPFQVPCPREPREDSLQHVFLQSLLRRYLTSSWFSAAPKFRQFLYYPSPLVDQWSVAKPPEAWSLPNETSIFPPSALLEPSGGSDLNTVTTGGIDPDSTLRLRSQSTPKQMRTTPRAGEISDAEESKIASWSVQLRLVLCDTARMLCAAVSFDNELGTLLFQIQRLAVQRSTSSQDLFRGLPSFPVTSIMSLPEPTLELVLLELAQSAAVLPQDRLRAGTLAACVGRRRELLQFLPSSAEARGKLLHLISEFNSLPPDSSGKLWAPAELTQTLGFAQKYQDSALRSLSNTPPIRSRRRSITGGALDFRPNIRGKLDLPMFPTKSLSMLDVAHHLCFSWLMLQLPQLTHYYSTTSTSSSAITSLSGEAAFALLTEGLAPASLSTNSDEMTRTPQMLPSVAAARERYFEGKSPARTSGNVVIIQKLPGEYPSPPDTKYRITVFGSRSNVSDRRLESADWVFRRSGGGRTVDFDWNQGQMLKGVAFFLLMLENHRPDIVQAGRSELRSLLSTSKPSSS